MSFTFPPYLSRLAAPGVCRAAVLTALVAATGPCAAVDAAGKKTITVGPAPPRVQVPVPDIRANIMRRLREGASTRPLPAPDPSATAPDAEAGPAPDAPTAPAASAGTPGPGPAPQGETGGPAARRTGPATEESAPVEWEPGRHYPVPEKTLTIRQLQDVDRLAEELEQARRRREDGPPE